MSQTPLLIWLQGGPGCSSMIGNFFELGPWRVTKSLNLAPNPGSWNRIFGLLFSIAQSELDSVSPQTLVKSPDFKFRPIYINGESYAGKYVPAIGYYILHRNSRFNLAAVSIGDGLTHPVVQVATHALNAYYVGLISEKQKNELEKVQSEAISLTQPFCVCD